jgi:DNA-binding IclR family transcriptional regulator
MTTRYATVAAIARAMRVVEVLARHPGGLLLTELAAELESPAATVHRLLQSLQRRGYIIRMPASGRYRLSLRIIGLAYRYLRTLDWKRHYTSVLESLSAETGELAQVAVVTQGVLFFLDKVEGHHALRVASLVGTEAPVHATASGKVWLASLADEELMEAIGKIELRRYTERTIGDLGRLLAEIWEIRRRGWAFSDEELMPGVCGMAVPIRPSTGPTVVGALSLAFPALRRAVALREYPAALTRWGAQLSGFGDQVHRMFFTGRRGGDDAAG